jgi:triosephosphate isomerase
MIFVNFKTYPQGTGVEAAALAHIIEAVAAETQMKIIPVVQAADVREIVSQTKLEVWVQHVDNVEYGANTGATLPEAVMEDGARGTFLNHSERKFLEFSELSEAVKRSAMVGLKTLVFASDIEELGKVVALSPTFVAYEPTELVGSTTTSVSSAHPDMILEASKLAKEHGVPLIVGAGIHSVDDIRTGLKLGAAGFAIATNIVKADDPKKELLALIEGFNG